MQNNFLTIKDTSKDVSNTKRASKSDDLTYQGSSHEEIILNCNKKLLEITE